ncbi:MAG: hypothetical protein LAN37_08000 [Acidobacteriia bacterium]|nr:hypothetical protein [Terriglobia bacterium]
MANLAFRQEMDRVRFITHEGKQILLIDNTSCSSREIIENYTECQRIVTAEPMNSVLTLSDFTDAEVDRTALTRMKEVAVLDRPHVKRAAITGVDSLPDTYYRSLMSFSVREFPAFKTREEALDWLVQD